MNSKSDEKYADVIAKYPELRFVYDELLDLINKHGMPKVGRWVYCKHCYKHVLPEFAFVAGLVKCSSCDAGIAPLDRVIKAGSYRQWEAQTESDWRFKNIIG